MPALTKKKPLRKKKRVVTPPPKRKQASKKPSLLKELKAPGGKGDWRGHLHGLVGATSSQQRYPGGHVGQAARGVKSYIRKRKAAKKKK